MLKCFISILLICFIPVLLNAQINVSFTFTPDHSCSGTPVQFRSTVTGGGSSPYIYAWVFGDGFTSNIANPTHSYNIFGCNEQPFNVILTVRDTSNGGNRTNSFNGIVTVKRRPNPKLTDLLNDPQFSNCEKDPTPGNSNFPIQVQNITPDNSCILSYTLNWGDGSPPVTNLLNGSFPLNHTYTQLGAFDLTITAFGTNGCNGTTIYVVKNQSNPAVGLSTSGSTQGCAPKTYSFVMSNYSLNSPGTTYLWDFGDGSPTIIWTQDSVVANNETISHTFNTTSCGITNNEFIVSVTASNSCSSTSATVSGIKIWSSPTANFNQNLLQGCTNSTSFCFFNTTIAGAYGSSCSSTTTYLWNFGNGQTSTLYSPPCQVYTTSGTYSISLVASNTCGSSTISKQISVQEPPDAVAVVDKNSGCVPFNVNLTNNSTGSGNQYTWVVNPVSGWSFANGTSNHSQNPVLRFSVIGIYNVTLNVVNACGSDQISFTITANGVPSISIPAIPDDCLPYSYTGNASFINNGSIISSYSWSVNQVGGWDFVAPSNSGSQNPTILFSQAGTYQVTVHAINGCGTASATSNQINVLNLQQVNAGNDTNVCINTGNIQLRGNPSGGLWNGNNVTTTGIFSPLTVGTFTLTYSRGTGNCLYQDQVVVTISPRPAVNAGPDIPVCLNAGLRTLTGEPAGGIWSGTGIIDGTLGIFDPTTSGVGSFLITYTYTDNSSKCSGSDALFLTVFPFPAVIAEDVTLCNQPIPEQLAAIPAGGTWSGSNVSPTGLFTPNGTGNFVLVYSYTNNNGCSNSDQMTVFVINPTAVTAGKDTSVCINSGSFQLRGNPSGGTWSGNHVMATGLFSPVAIGAHTLTYTRGNGNCLTKDEVVVTVLPRPVVHAGTDIQLCINDGLRILAGEPVGGIWSGTGIINSTQGTFDPLITGAGSFSITYTFTDNISSCSESDALTISVLPFPAILAEDVTLCNQPIPEQLVASPSGGTWSGPNVTPTGLFTPNGTGIFSLVYSYTNTNGCSNSDHMTVFVINPTIVTAGNDTSVCLNSGNFQLSGNPSGGIWSGNNVNASGIFSTVAAGAFTLTYSRGTGNCLYQDQVVVRVLPNPTVNAGTDIPICINAGLLTLTGNPVGGTWSGTGILNSTQGIFNPLISGIGSFPITYTFVDNISTCSSSDALIITVSPFPVVNADDATLCNQPIPEQLAASPEGGTWSGPNVTSTGLFTPNGTGTYILIYSFTGNNGCSNYDSATVTVINPDTTVSAGKDISICSYETVLLAGKPAGGTWSGPTVTPDGFFKPVSVGNYWLLYGIGKGSCRTTDSTLVRVMPSPKADFTSGAVCFGETTVFNDLSLGGGVNLTSWIWNFGDHTTAQLQNPSHTYLASGTYPATLTVGNENGCVDSVIKPVEVMKLPTVDFDFNIPACINIPVLFNNNSTNAESYLWDFGDQTISSNFEPTHTYRNAGSFQVILMARSGAGCLYSDSLVIDITRPPPAPLFQLSPKEGCSPLVIYLTIDTSEYNNNSSYYWDFGNGLTSNSLIPPDSLVYPGSAGGDSVFHIRFVSYNVCDSLVYSDSILVHPSPLSEFEMLHNWDCTPVEVHFKNISQGLPESFSWNFGDGTTSSVTEPVHIYTTGVNSSIYRISLISYNGCGTDTLTRELLVKPNSVDAFFTDGNFKGCAGDVFCFQNFSTDTSGVGISNLSWDFGDGQGSSTENPCHIFEHAGNYIVKLHVDNGCGHDDAYDTIEINPVPQIEIRLNNEACVGEELLFTYSANIDIAGKTWYFGDGDSSLLSNPTHSFLQEGSYKVILTGVSASGFPVCTGQASTQVVIKPVPDAFILPDTSGCAPLQITFQGDTGSFHLWNFGDNPVFTSNPTHIFNSEGEFWVKLISENKHRCRDSDSIKIRIFPSPQSQFTYTSSGGYPEYLTFVNSSAGATECAWDFGNGLHITSCEAKDPIEYRYNNTYLITLLVLNEYGCSDTASASYAVNFKGLFVPNALIPEHADPDENLFLPKGIGIVEYSIQLFDTWGNLIWQSSVLDKGMPAEGWNGRDKNGNLYPQDVYVWRASAKFADGTYWSGKNGKTYGTVTLIR